MIIYLSLVVPFITVFILYKYFNHKVVWWELFLPIVLSALFIFGSKSLIESSQVQSKEYWGSLVTRAEYYEDWDEWISQTCTETYGCDSKGNNCKTRTYDCSYRRYHPAEYILFTKNNEVIRVDEKEYFEVQRKFGNSNFVDLKRDYYEKNGNEYYTSWDGDPLKSVPTSTIHYYENRVKVCDQSIFHFLEVTEGDRNKYSLKDYPELVSNYKLQSLLGYQGGDFESLNNKLNYFNGLLGEKKQVRMFILIFENQPIEAAFYQECYWSGGNKNEFVLCIGVDKQKNIKWCKPFSWTTSEILKVDLRNYVQSQQVLNLEDVINQMKVEVSKNFSRRHFKEFNYLTVEPPLWAVIVTFILTVGLNFGLAYWCVVNDFNEDTSSSN